MPRVSPVVLAVGVLLAATSVGFAVRAVDLDPEAMRGPSHGRYTPARAVEVRGMIRRLAHGLLACQEPNGWFRRAPSGAEAHPTDEERVAASMLATAALAVAHADEAHEQPDPDVAAGLALAFAYLRAKQEPAGPIGRAPPGDPWPQVEATAAAALALGLVDLPEADDALVRKDACGALVRMSREGVRNGYTRALVAMVAERLATLDLEELLGGSARDLVEPRSIDTMPANEGYELWDTTLSEVIARTVLGLKRGLDPLPGRVLTAILAKPPTWNADASDVRTWWMQGWIVARAQKGDAWFAALADVLERWADDEPAMVPTSFYTSSLVQTACAILALDEGLRAD